MKPRKCAPFWSEVHLFRPSGRWVVSVAPILLSSLHPCTLQCDFVVPSIKQSFPHLLILSLAMWLALTNRMLTVAVQTGFWKSTCAFPLLLLLPFLSQGKVSGQLVEDWSQGAEPSHPRHPRWGDRSSETLGLSGRHLGVILLGSDGLWLFPLLFVKSQAFR